MPEVGRRLRVIVVSVLVGSAVGGVVLLRPHGATTVAVTAHRSPETEADVEDAATTSTLLVPTTIATTSTTAAPTTTRPTPTTAGRHPATLDTSHVPSSVTTAPVQSHNPNGTPCTFVTSSYPSSKSRTPGAASVGVDVTAPSHPNENMNLWLYAPDGKLISNGGAKADGSGLAKWGVFIPASYEGQQLSAHVEYVGATTTPCDPDPYKWIFPVMQDIP